MPLILLAGLIGAGAGGGFFAFGSKAGDGAREGQVAAAVIVSGAVAAYIVVRAMRR
ncbi:hypothetical protein [Neotabrizicola shimadae]|uniref:Uncharacterized protein n=1 Tax=Neotabrizicola shimadae TaxID=2807096 RepID=A0A8G1EED8_9RHOB|nr:hypothetical protein [Neotabrizicola shimadae]QYZ71216.1 hypothetical protein JO391_06845 [Neotabrizicola shimadae]